MYSKHNFNICFITVEDRSLSKIKTEHLQWKGWLSVKVSFAHHIIFFVLIRKFKSENEYKTNYENFNFLSINPHLVVTLDHSINYYEEEEASSISHTSSSTPIFSPKNKYSCTRSSLQLFSRWPLDFCTESPTHTHTYIHKTLLEIGIRN